MSQAPRRGPGFLGPDAPVEREPHGARDVSCMSSVLSTHSAPGRAALPRQHSCARGLFPWLTTSMLNIGVPDRSDGAHTCTRKWGVDANPSAHNSSENVKEGHPVARKRVRELPQSMRLPISAPHTALFSVVPSHNPSGCLVPFVVDRATHRAGRLSKGPLSEGVGRRQGEHRSAAAPFGSNPDQSSNLRAPRCQL